MAKKDTAKTIERVYNVPLRKGYRKAPLYKRSKKAVATMRQFLAKHMKSENIKLSKEVNEKIWKHGIRNPPHHVKVTVTKNEEGEVRAELFGLKKEAPKKKGKTPKTTPKANAKETPAPAVKEAEKEEIKVAPKEEPKTATQSPEPKTEEKGAASSPK